MRERLERLALGRAVLVTAFLGSAVAIDLTSVGDVSDPRNLSLLALIVLTYLMTIGYGAALRRQFPLHRLAYIQLLGDIGLATGLTLVTGGFESLFLFFFHLTIINAAIIIDRRAALIFAGITTAVMIYLATITTGWLPNPLIDLPLREATPTELFYQVSINSVAGFLIALLAGQLSARLGRAARELARRQSDIADLRALNQHILASLSSGLLTVDRDGTIIFFNSAAEQITGLDADDALGRPLEELFPHIADRAASHQHQSEASSDSISRLESPYQRPDGQSLHLGFSLSPLRNSSGEQIGRIIIFQDLSDIKDMEARMKRSERLAAVGELSAAIAHEIRNPLASISGSVEMLDQKMDSEDDQTLMKIIVREVDRLNLLISDFLDYSQPGAIDTDEQPILPILNDVVQLFRHSREFEDLQIDVEPTPDGEAIVDIDAEAIRQVYWNLLRNAAHAMEDCPGHKICLDARISDDRSTIIFGVEDDGTGVEEQAKARLFEPFFTTRDSGTGLGLATTYRLLEEQGGTIDVVEPRTLGGARFEFQLPLVEIRSTATAEAGSPQGS